MRLIPLPVALVAPLVAVLVALAPAPARGADAPKADLTLKDAYGQKVRLRDLRGKPVVLNFWATWCVPCTAEMPMLVAMETEYATRGVLFVAASLDDAKTKANIPGFLAEHKIGFPVWYGATADDLDQLKLGGAVPATAFLDAEGRIVARILGQARPEEVKERLDWLTGDKSAPPPQPVVKHLQ
ncbi:MAG TPA: TlpA disulfide reductase family protein [Candidatus Acidoferrales bacterium]|jgi:thiol-disulfide isomerase/thioredoxin|nr:TlpA disulfide reductase family protein [Candidatus Acidoferrales bacterium]